MKKLICISIIAVLLMTSVSFAETIDVKSLSDDELAELNKTIQAELFSRHIAGSGVPIPPGRYLIGTDIPAGRYQVVVNEDVAVATFEVINNLKYNSGKTYWLGTVYGGTTANITLDEGMALEVDSRVITLRPFTSLF